MYKVLFHLFGPGGDAALPLQVFCVCGMELPHEAEGRVELLGHGAEGRVYSVPSFHGRVAVVKERAKKAYRVPELDAVLTKKRLVQEARCIVKARRAGVRVPCLYDVDLKTSRIVMERVEGKTMKRTIFDGVSDEVALALGRRVGTSVAQLHDADIVHGDLTTSNMMVSTSASASGETGVTTKTDVADGDMDVVLIDFGLASSSRPNAEEKAVDLYVLERAFVSTHPNTEHIVAAVIKAYRQRSRNQGPTLQKLEEVRMRGRKREMIG